MEHRKQGARHKHIVLAIVSALVILGIAIVGIWQSNVKAANSANPNAVEKVNIHVAKYWYKTMPSGAGSLIDNKGTMFTPNSEIAQPEKDAMFAMYSLNSKENGSEKIFTDAMYSDLVTLVNSFRFDAIKETIPEINVALFSSPVIKEALVKALPAVDKDKTSSEDGIHITGTSTDDMKAQLSNTKTTTATTVFNNIMTQFMAELSKGGGALRYCVQIEKNNTPTLNNQATVLDNDTGVASYVYEKMENETRYVLIETQAGKNGERQVATPMILDLPIMKEDGSGAPLNNVQKGDTDENPDLYVYPKNEYPVGGAKFYKYDGKTKQRLAGAKFLLFKVDEMSDTEWGKLHEQQLDVTTKIDDETIYEANGTTLKEPTFAEDEEYDIGNLSVHQVNSNETGNQNGEFTSGSSVNAGLVSASGLEKGRYFWVEAKHVTVGGENYALNRYPICFEIDNESADGGTNATVRSKGITTINDDTVAFPNYARPDFHKTLTVTHTGGSKTVTDNDLVMDNQNISKFNYTLSASLPDNGIVFGVGTEYLSYYDIFATKKIGPWDIDNRGDTDALLNVKDVFKESDFPTGGSPEKDFYYDEGQQTIPVTRITTTTAEPRLELRDSSGLIGYYASTADSTDDPKYLGKFMDQYKTGTATAIGSGIAHLGWWDLADDYRLNDENWDDDNPAPFESGTAKGTQLVCTFNIPQIKLDVNNKIQNKTFADINQVDFKFSATPIAGLFDKGVQIDNIGQFEWFGGASEDTVIEKEVNFQTGGQNFVKVNGSKTGSESNFLPGAQFQIYRKVWDTTGQKWDISYLQAANAVEEPYAAATSTSVQVKKWIPLSSLSDDTTETYFVDKKKGASGVEDNPTVFKSSGDAGTKLGLISVRGLAPAQTNPDTEKTGSAVLNKKTHYFIKEIKTPNAELNGAQQYRIQKKPVQFEVVAEDLFNPAQSSLKRLNANANVTNNKTATAETPYAVANNNLVEIINIKPTPFPITGGIGSLFLILLGLLGVAYWYMRKRRMALAEQEAE